MQKKGVEKKKKRNGFFASNTLTEIIFYSEEDLFKDRK